MEEELLSMLHASLIRKELSRSKKGSYETPKNQMPISLSYTGKGFALARMSNGMQWHYKIFLGLNLRLSLIELRLPPPDFVSPREREGGVPL